MAFPTDRLCGPCAKIPKRKGLLFAGTETGVFVSKDSGAHWTSLQLNLPTVPVHDLVIKDNDLLLATHGRSFWILDDITPLRESSAESEKADFWLYPPAIALRMHRPYGRAIAYRGRESSGGRHHLCLHKEQAEGGETRDPGWLG